MAAKRVLSIGQCNADYYGIRTTLDAHFDVEVTPAATASEAVDWMRREKYDLILVNRILDADGASGLEVIARLKSSTDAPPIMLVSNYPEYQQQAERLGAAPGFGKGDMDDAETVKRLSKFLS